MRRKYIIQVLVVSLIIGMGGYTWLGGWRKAELTTATADEAYVLVGREFKGDYDDPQLGRDFESLKGYKQDGTLSGDFAVVYFQHPEDFEGETHQMIGVLFPASEVPTTFPQDLSAKELPGTRWVRAKLTNHVAVMPSPKNVREQLHEYAQTEGLSLEIMSIEKYYSDRHLEIEIPVAE